MTARAPVGGPFSLTDHFGRVVTERTFLGRPALLYFGFTHCRVVCPRALARLSAALELAVATPERIQPLLISVDPERDTPAVLRAYCEAHHPRFLGLTGDRAAIEAMKLAYKVFARRVADAEDPQGYAVAHTAFSYLIGTDGGYVTHFTDVADEQRIAATIASAIA
ncbi:SCO family protein [Sphingomonas bacterium]|uniref:SCO family protein n=1 Tax=Sphingomonas bacterium TaxID=1895847 RepID=UPI001576F7F9|nr:SCO family protein [Sphingomonas bacterium]